MHEQDIYWILLNEMRGITLSHKRKLISALSRPENIFHASPITIEDILETGKGRPGSVADSRRESYGSIWSSRSLADAETILANNAQHSIHLLSLITHTTRVSMQMIQKHHSCFTTKASSPHLKYPLLVSSGLVQVHPTGTW